MSSLNQLLLDVHRAFNDEKLDHAFGGALALMHYVADPRMTRDIDVNLFVSESEVERVLQSLSHLAEVVPAHSKELLDKGFVRLISGLYPIDVFISVHEFHDDMRLRVEMHKVGEASLPFISATHLAVLKALFDRPKDWVDILEMMKFGSVDIHHALGWLTTMTSERDERPARLRAFSLARPEDLNLENFSFENLINRRKN